MNFMSHHNRIALHTVLVFVITLSAGFSTIPTVAAADQPIRKDRIRSILNRQDTSILRVYLNTKSPYVNGNSVTAAELTAIVKKCGLKQAILAPEPNVADDRVAEVKRLIVDAGIKRIEMSTPKIQAEAYRKRQEQKKLAQQKQKQKNPTQSTARKTDRSATPTPTDTAAIILDRQKGDQLNVYMNTRGTYVNGKSVNPEVLTKVIRKSRLGQAMLTAEPDVKHERVVTVMDIIRQAGISNIKLTTAKPKQTDAKYKQVKPIHQVKPVKPDKRVNTQHVAGPILVDTVKVILYRQKQKGADELNVYLRNATTIHVQGKQISLETLGKLVRKVKADQAIISAEPIVPKQRLMQVKDVITNAGIKHVKFTTPQQQAKQRQKASSR